MKVVGICGTDVHILTKGRLGHFLVEKPIVLGHEGAGIVMKTGKDVKHLKPGDRVAIEPGIPCRHCEYCRNGKYNLCKGMIVSGIPPSGKGLLINYRLYDADFCFKLPDKVTFSEGAMVETLSVGVQACKKGGVHMGTVAIIFGAGPVGLTTLLAAQAYGASQTVIVDTKKFRLHMAKTIGANHTIRIKGNETTQELKKIILSQLKTKADVCFDSSGAETAIKTAFEVTKAAGKVVLIGFETTEIFLSLKSVIFNEVEATGVIRYVNTWPTAIEMITSGRVKLKPLITHTYPMKDALRAFEHARKGFLNAIKIQIALNPQIKNK